MYKIFTRMLIAVAVLTTTSLAQSPPTCPPPAMPECRPGFVAKKTGVDKAGCPVYTCVKKRQCPPAVMPECRPGFIVKKKADKSGCPKYTCVKKRECPPVPMPGCQPGFRMVTDRDPQTGCPTAHRCVPV